MLDQKKIDRAKDISAKPYTANTAEETIQDSRSPSGENFVHAVFGTAIQGLHSPLSPAMSVAPRYKVGNGFGTTKWGQSVFGGKNMNAKKTKKLTREGITIEGKPE